MHMDDNVELIDAQGGHSCFCRSRVGMGSVLSRRRTPSINLEHKRFHLTHEAFPLFVLSQVDDGSVGVGHGLLVERCRFLEAAGCASVCMNTCKASSLLPGPLLRGAIVFRTHDEPKNPYIPLGYEPYLVLIMFPRNI